MTDNEIIKALECCMDEMGCTKGCPCFVPKAKGSHCTVSKKLELEKLTLDLINRQKAEIRKYKNCYEQVKWERDLFEEQCKTAKAEAYKEFAERLKKKIFPLGNIYNDGNYPINAKAVKVTIDNLVKEMVGENDAE